METVPVPVIELGRALGFGPLWPRSHLPLCNRITTANVMVTDTEPMIPSLFPEMDKQAVQKLGRLRSAPDRNPGVGSG
jgi:hypothetical protein